MIKKISLVLGVVVLCAASFAGGYVRGKYVEAHKSIYGLYGFDVKTCDANNHLQPTGYKATGSDYAAHLIIVMPKK